MMSWAPYIALIHARQAFACGCVNTQAAYGKTLSRRNSYEAATGTPAGVSRLGGVQIVCLNWVAGFMAYILMNQSRSSTPCMRKQA